MTSALITVPTVPIFLGWRSFPGCGLSELKIGKFWAKQDKMVTLTLVSPGLDNLGLQI